MINIKYINLSQAKYPDGRGPIVEFDGCRFIQDSHCTEYDWLVVFDDFPRASLGTIVRETEHLACPREKTILVTQEPPSIKIYPSAYTAQYGYVLTTHLPQHLPHPHHRIGRGCVLWMADYSLEEAFSAPDYAKTKVLSTVCSAKQMKHTEHNNRYRLTRYVADHVPELEWYGRGVRDLGKKYEALNDYKYHIAVENYIRDYHWTDKISDPLLGLCLTFYAGDPKLGEVLPPESFIPIPLDKPEEALRIIREAIDNGEYEKRLPAIREARRRILDHYNFFRQVAATVNAHEEAESRGIIPKAEKKPFILRGRHAMRKRRLGLNALAEAWESNAYKLGAKLSGHDHAGRKAKEERPLRYVRLQGRLGEQMLQYAFAKALETQTHAEVRLLPEVGGCPLSGLPLSLAVADTAEAARALYGIGPAALLRRTLGKTCCLHERDMDPLLNALPSLPPHVVAEGSFRRILYADSVRASLENDFSTESLPLSAEAEAARASIREANGEAIALHLRCSADAPSADYYASALRTLNAQLGSRPLYVITDAPQTAAAILGNTPATIVQADALTTLAVARTCRHHIIDTDLLSLWGAWLGQREGSCIIAPAAMGDAHCPGLLPASWLTL